MAPILLANSGFTSQGSLKSQTAPGTLSPVCHLCTWWEISLRIGLKISKSGNLSKKWKLWLRLEGLPVFTDIQDFNWILVDLLAPAFTFTC